MHDILRGCLAALEPLAAKRGIRFVENIAPATIRGVHDHVVMMIDNVLANAVAYSHDGQQVAVSCRPKPAGGAVVGVEDSGIGIPTAKLPQIFDDYFRTAEAVKHNKASTGLGLAIVRQAAMAGKVGVRVESAPQQGTLFNLDFPACWGEDRGPTTYQPGDLIMAYILIVDDDADFAGAVSTMLKSHGTRRPPRPTPTRPSIAFASGVPTRWSSTSCSPRTTRPVSTSPAPSAAISAACPSCS